MYIEQCAQKSIAAMNRTRRWIGIHEPLHCNVRTCVNCNAVRLHIALCTNTILGNYGHTTDRPIGSTGLERSTYQQKREGQQPPSNARGCVRRKSKSRKCGNSTEQTVHGGTGCSNHRLCTSVYFPLWLLPFHLLWHCSGAAYPLGSPQ